METPTGKLGKYGDPQQLRVSVEGKEWRVWVEQRGPQLVSRSSHLSCPSLITFCPVWIDPVWRHR